MSKFVITSVPTHEVRRYWKFVAPFLRPAIELSGGRWTEPYVLAALALGEQLLWVIGEGSEPIAAMTTEIVAYPEKRALAMHFMGGSRFDEFYPELHDVIVDYAKRNGCEIIESNARLGFAKWFSPSGFTRPSVFYELRIEK